MTLKYISELILWFCVRPFDHSGKLENREKYHHALDLSFTANISKDRLISSSSSSNSIFHILGMWRMVDEFHSPVSVQKCISFIEVALKRDLYTDLNNYSDQQLFHCTYGHVAMVTLENFCLLAVQHYASLEILHLKGGTCPCCCVPKRL